jgi:hypothetical protein
MDEQRIKQLAMSLWRRGGMDSLVKVMPRGRSPDANLNIGYCTTFKYVVGRTPAEMENVVGLRVGSKLTNGASIFLVRPLPGPTQFRLSGYSQTPEGISTAIKPHHPDYPPGLGAPQWELMGYSQRGLVLLAEVQPGQKFAYRVAELPLPI